MIHHRDTKSTKGFNHRGHREHRGRSAIYVLLVRRGLGIQGGVGGLWGGDWMVARSHFLPIATGRDDRTSDFKAGLVFVASHSSVNRKGIKHDMRI